MKITFAEEGWSEYLYWQTQDKKIVKKINQLLQGNINQVFVFGDFAYLTDCKF